ncbi:MULTISPECIES: pyridoxamine 5'-phosphate oxidase family protein [Lactobacillus]|uniref:Pyridoxamine 5'-phosphate oxidase family protein n=1 Tax=Lactobacillus xujianguonis TaxID=2495899 RepID=A0A437SV10_9LACO|nr:MULTISPECIES: pyridoxamine 5'-phosphate oxidase family protein [Lactobacillus]RVU70744.1 pyridoxamine 5'-phosphate oxidase family protein [Lactobacillus xujianguonis]RVU73995.1 pyridoxamine 5'-phosphate oxidase family protein [Lactobacillus xujianguonis]
MKKLDSNKLTQEQQDFFANHLAFLSTVDANGEPQVGPKQSMKVLDEGHLTYLEKTKAHAYDNIKNGSKVAVVVADKPSHTNVRVKGTAHVHENDEYAQKVNGSDDAKNPYVVVIDIEEIDA